MSNAPIGIFVATMTGLAEICAEEIRTAIGRIGLGASIHVMDAESMKHISGYKTVIVVSSTYGHGDIPDNGRAFYEELTAADSLGDKAFAVFALGDRTYSTTFCHAGEKWDGLFSSKGASRLCPLMRHDASDGTLAEDVAGEWALGWVDVLKQAA